MKRLFTVLCLVVLCSLAGCAYPDEYYIFHKNRDQTLEYYKIETLCIRRYGTTNAEFKNHNDMETLFALAKKQILTRSSYEDNNLPSEYDYYYHVTFIHYDKKNLELSLKYSFILSTKGDICVERQRLAALSIWYIGYSEEILLEVNSLVEYYNS